MKKKITLLLILIMAFSVVPAYAGTSGIVITSKMKTYRTGSPKNNYVTGTINKASGCTVVLYDYQKSKVVAQQTLASNGRSANYSLAVPKLSKAGTYKYCVMATRGNAVVSNAVLVRVVYRKITVSDAKASTSSSSDVSDVAEKIASYAEGWSWPLGTSDKKYKWPKGGTYYGNFATYWKKYHPNWPVKKGACCCHSARLAIEAALDKRIKTGLLANAKGFEKYGFEVFKFNGDMNSLKRGDVLAYHKKGGGGHAWIYCGDGIIVEGGLTSGRFPCKYKWKKHWNNLSKYTSYYYVIRYPSSSTSTASTTVSRQKWYDAMTEQYNWSKNQTYKWVSNPTVNNSKANGTCITFVAVSLQRAGLLPSGKWFWYSPTKNKLEGSGVSYLKKHTEWFEISYPKKTVSQLYKAGKISKGDIIGFGGSADHSMVFMGMKDGTPIFNTMGHKRGLNVTYPYYAKKKVDLLVHLKI